MYSLSLFMCITHGICRAFAEAVTADRGYGTFVGLSEDIKTTAMEAVQFSARARHGLSPNYRVCISSG